MSEIISLFVHHTVAPIVNMTQLMGFLMLTMIFIIPLPLYTVLLPPK